MYIIGGIYRNRKIITPKGSQTRPTTGNLREALFNICQGYIEGARFLDLFSGSGAMGLEALSRGAATAVFVDNHKNSIQCIKSNIKSLQLEKQARVLFGDVAVLINKLNALGERFDIIYADPPYHRYGLDQGKKGQDILFSHQVLQGIDGSSLLMPTGVLFIEEAYEAPPYPEPLKTLLFKGSRKKGRSTLYEYVKQQNRVVEEII